MRSGTAPAALRAGKRAMEAAAAPQANDAHVLRACRLLLADVRTVCPAFGRAPLTEPQVAALLERAGARRRADWLQRESPLWPYCPMPLADRSPGYLLGADLPAAARLFLEVRHALMFWRAADLGPRHGYASGEAEVLGLLAVFNVEVCTDPNATARALALRDELRAGGCTERGFSWTGSFKRALRMADCLLAEEPT